MLTVRSCAPCIHRGLEALIEYGINNVCLGRSPVFWRGRPPMGHPEMLRSNEHSGLFSRRLGKERNQYFGGDRTYCVERSELRNRDNGVGESGGPEVTGSEDMSGLQG